MGEVINLRSAKQRVIRDRKAAEAKENRIRHGRTGSEKANDRRVEARRAEQLDALRRSEAGDALRRADTDRSGEAGE